jgi:nucleotide-binding universal stress UspA family protein
VARHLKDFLRDSAIQIEPTAVLNPGQLRIPQGQNELKSPFKSATEASLKKVTTSLKLHHLLPTSFIFCEYYSQKSSVETFLAFAQERKAELIAVGTHSRLGLERWLLRSSPNR